MNTATIIYTDGRTLPANGQGMGRFLSVRRTVQVSPWW
jgi:hypothetical protein